MRDVDRIDKREVATKKGTWNSRSMDLDIDRVTKL